MGWRFETATNPTRQLTPGGHGRSCWMPLARRSYAGRWGAAGYFKGILQRAS
jgi:hypothetical protein